MSRPSRETIEKELTHEQEGGDPPEMYKTDVIRKIAKDTRVSQSVTGEVINAFLNTVQQSLKDGKTVTLPGFGTFYASQRAAGKLRHIRTGAMVDYAARRVALFRAGDVLKRTVQVHRGRKKRFW